MNIIAKALFSKHTKIVMIALKFFLGKYAGRGLSGQPRHIQSREFYNGWTEPFSRGVPTPGRGFTAFLLGAKCRKVFFL